MKELLEKFFNLDDDQEREVLVQDGMQDDAVVKNEKLTFEKDLEIIIASDNHRIIKGLTQILAHYPDADYFLHCGDANLESDHDVMRSFIAVRGNTDYHEGYADDEFVDLASGERIWITHGHRYSVNFGTDNLVKNTKLGFTVTSPVDIILYGHTHKVDVKMQEGMLIINPGSITRPRDGVLQTYARLLITTDYYDIQILDVSDHSIIKEFRFPRE